MLHACVQRFDVTGNLEKFGILGATEQGLSRCGCRLLGDATVLCIAENIQANVIIGIYDGFR
jgi:hypothetical protein